MYARHEKVCIDDFVLKTSRGIFVYVEIVERIIIKRILQNHYINWNKVAQNKQWDIMQICDEMLILI